MCPALNILHVSEIKRRKIKRGAVSFTKNKPSIHEKIFADEFPEAALSGKRILSSANRKMSFDTDHEENCGYDT